MEANIYRLSRANILTAINYRFIKHTPDGARAKCKVCGVTSADGRLMHKDDCLVARALDAVEAAKERY